MTGRRVLISLLTTLCCAPAALAQSAEPFWAGKQMRMIIRSGVGGGYDHYARLLGRHIGRHIPGNPTVVPVNMPGAGGIVAANYVAAVAPQDGTILTMVSQGLPVDQALGLNPTFKADLRTFNWVGNMSNSNQILAVWHTSATRTLADAKRRETVIGSTGAGSISTQLPVLMNQIIGTKFRIIAGYSDGKDVDIAMERGEVEGRGTNPWASYKSAQQRLVKEKLIVPIIQIGLEKEPDLPHIPLLLDEKVGPEEQAVLAFMSKAITVGRPIATTPGVPADRVALLRTAFDRAVVDPQFVAEANSSGAEIDPMPGGILAQIIDDLIGAPQSVRDRVKAAIQSGDAIQKAKGAK